MKPWIHADCAIFEQVDFPKGFQRMGFKFFIIILHALVLADYKVRTDVNKAHKILCIM